MAITRIGKPAIADVRGVNFRNIIINGDQSIAQRSTSTSSANTSAYHCTDRWNNIGMSIGTWTISQSTEVPTGQGFAKSLKYDCTTAEASPSAGDQLHLSQRIEGQNLQYLLKGTSSAKSLTLSFWVKTNKTGTYQVNLRDKDNTRIIGKTYAVSSADTWEKKILTFAGDTTGALDDNNEGSFAIFIWLHAGSTYNSGTLNTSWNSVTNANRVDSNNTSFLDSTSRTFFITGWQMEIGEKATEFEHESFETTLRKCQRYYLKRQAGSDYSYWASGHNASTSAARLHQNFPVEMNHIPVLETSAASTFYVYSVDTVDLSDVPTINNPSVWGSAVTFPTASSGLTAGRGANAIAKDSAGTAYLAFESEL